VILLWSFCVPSVILLCSFCDPSVILLWSFCDPTMLSSVFLLWSYCVLGSYCGPAVFPLWSFCVSTVLLWPWFVPTVLLWSFYIASVFHLWSYCASVVLLYSFCGPTVLLCSFWGPSLVLSTATHLWYIEWMRRWINCIEIWSQILKKNTPYSAAVVCLGSLRHMYKVVFESQMFNRVYVQTKTGHDITSMLFYWRKSLAALLDWTWVLSCWKV
jgi:hypothetical protein